MLLNYLSTGIYTRLTSVSTSRVAKLDNYGLYTPSPTSFINVVSNADSGFVRSGDSDPFTSGQPVTYALQGMLPPGTYYWRVRGLDPSGLNYYGAWSSTRSIVVYRRNFPIWL